MKKIRLVIVFCILVLLMSACGNVEPVSSSGANVVSAEVSVDSQGRTAEQANIQARIELESSGSIKHLYVISPYSGQVILYSTVQGKVTSSGKSLRPKTAGGEYGEYLIPGVPDSKGYDTLTNEVMGDDGSWGSSVEYIYWWDSQGRYHQHFFTGGQIIHLSDFPIAVTNIILNLELSD